MVTNRQILGVGRLSHRLPQMVGQTPAEVLFLKHESSILRQSSNHVCGSP